MGERFVPYFLDKFKAASSYAGRAGTYILFPDSGAFNRYVDSVRERLKLDCDHILYIEKTRVGEVTEQVQKLFYKEESAVLEKSAFLHTDSVLIIDDFTNSGGTLLGAVDLVRKMVEGAGTPSVSIFVSHLVAAYDPKVVSTLQEKLKKLGPTCHFY